MHRKLAALLFAALITTKAFAVSTPQDVSPMVRASSATHAQSSATGIHAASTIAPSGALQKEYPSTADDYTTHSLSLQEEKLLKLINLDRAAKGLPALAADPELSRIARIKSEDMRDNRYFAHESPTYGKARQMLERFGYRFSGVGENIAHHATVEKAQAAFMTSEGHRRNILSSVWQKVGVGVCYDANGYIYATQIFVR